MTFASKFLSIAKRAPSTGGIDRTLRWHVAPRKHDLPVDVAIAGGHGSFYILDSATVLEPAFWRFLWRAYSGRLKAGLQPTFTAVSAQAGPAQALSVSAARNE